MSSILGLILLLILGFVIRAVASPSVSFQAEIKLNSTPELVWPYIVDEGKRVVWQTGVRTVVSLMGGDMVMGSRSIVIKRIGSKQWEIEEEIVDFIEDESFAVVHSTEDYVENIIISLENKGGSVNLIYSSSKIHNAFWDRLIAPWTSFKEHNSLDVSLQALKRQVNNTTP